MFGKTHSVALVGMDGHLVDVEVSVVPGIPTFTIVGLPDTSIQEARERVRAAIVTSGEKWPQQRVTVNLSPAHLRKTGSSFDLAVALGILAAQDRIAQERLHRLCALGELSLDGKLRRVRGVLPSVMTAARRGARAVLVPAANAGEAALVREIEVFPIEHLADAVRFLRGERALEPFRSDGSVPPDDESGEDLEDVRGQALAKRVLEIAAAGGHNVLMIGPPGGGKTMLARRLPGILPPMTEAESFEVTRVYSVAGLLPEDRVLLTRRPFRSPHHTCSTTGLVGGGSGVPHPGEASLATRGVLFLDEFSEFRNDALQALRQPMEEGEITIVRARWAVRFPARFQLVAASNPCPCGFTGDSVRPCECAPGRVAAYRERLTGPVIDRIDLQMLVQRVGRSQIFGEPEGDPSAAVRARVTSARERQRERLRFLGLGSNTEIPASALEDACRLEPGARATIEEAIERMGLSARGAHRVARVARTVADLAGSEPVHADHVDEALMFRVMDAGILL